MNNKYMYTFLAVGTGLYMTINSLKLSESQYLYNKEMYVSLLTTLFTINICDVSK